MHYSLIALAILTYLMYKENIDIKNYKNFEVHQIILIVAIITLLYCDYKDIDLLKIVGLDGLGIEPFSKKVVKTPIKKSVNNIAMAADSNGFIRNATHVDDNTVKNIIGKKLIVSGEFTIDLSSVPTQSTPRVFYIKNTSVDGVGEINAKDNRKGGADYYFGAKLKQNQWYKVQILLRQKPGVSKQFNTLKIEETSEVMG